MRLRKALDEKLMDLRLRDRLVAEGKISAAEVEKFLSQIPDSTNEIYEEPEKKTEPSAEETPENSSF
ncbi:hypothetical protein N9N67_10725 [Bacteriovoracaceae bacterium]|nr:hypothetical protein [Bacteriovoracaceae bacterium]